MRLYLSSFNLGNKPEELLALLGGKTRTAVILNAGDAGPEHRRSASLEREVNNLKGLGLDPTDVDLRDFFGRPEALRDVLQGFDLLWVRGGNCFVLRRAFRQSGADEIILDLLQRDAIVYAGYSAAIDMLVPSMQGSELVDDPTIVPDGYEAPIIWEGLNLIPYAVAPHYRSDHGESAMIDLAVEYLIDHHILFKALRDGQAIVIDANGERVVG
jgi:dipeptidase E